MWEECLKLDHIGIFQLCCSRELNSYLNSIFITNDFFILLLLGKFLYSHSLTY